MYDAKSFPQKTFPTEMNLLKAQQEKTRQRKAKSKGQDCYNMLKLTNCLKTQLSALHAQTLEAIFLHLEENLMKC